VRRGEESIQNPKSKIQNEESDVLVIGGGPAGSATATWLANEGFAVTLLDRTRFPRDKACGEFLTPQAGRLLAQLGVWDTLCRRGLREVAATVLVAADGRQMRHEPHDGNPTGYALRRATLDAVLLEQARARGVQVREGFAVRELCRDEQGQVVGVKGKEENGEPATLRARLIIGADGSHSLIARQLGLVRPIPRLQRIAIVAHWRGVTGAQDTIEMRAHGPLVCGMGFPGDGDSSLPSANTTFVVPSSWASQIAGRAGEWIEQTVQTHFPDLADRLTGAARELPIRTIGCFGHRSASVVADGALLVGDAATFIDPFTGEGVYFCLRGAQLAAETATTALRRGDTSRPALQAYAGARRELAHRYFLIDMVQSVVRAPALLNQMIYRLERFPGAADRLLRILGDIRPATDALHPALLWRLFAPCF
jgi:flavin-dependent dehydrogenase